MYCCPSVLNKPLCAEVCSMNSPRLEADFQQLYQLLASHRLAPWLSHLPQQVKAAIYAQPHGKRDLWLETLATCLKFSLAAALLAKIRCALVLGAIWMK